MRRCSPVCHTSCRKLSPNMDSPNGVPSLLQALPAVSSVSEVMLMSIHLVISHRQSIKKASVLEMHSEEPRDIRFVTEILRQKKFHHLVHLFSYKKNTSVHARFLKNRNTSKIKQPMKGHTLSVKNFRSFLLNPARKNELEEM